MNAAPSSSALANDSHAAVIGSSALFGLRPYHEEAAVTIYHGDCRQIVPLLGRFDLLLTDPPYGIGDKWTKGVMAGKRGTSVLWGKGETWDDETPPDWLIEQCVRAAKKSIVWGGNYYAMPPARGWLSWDKVQEYSGGDFEMAWTNLDTAPRVFRMSRIDAYQNKAESKKAHPTEKPLQLMSWCIGLAGDVQTILDPFAGSGTTGRAAKDLGKCAVLIEREERYCEIAARRLSQDVLGLDCPNVRMSDRP